MQIQVPQGKQYINLPNGTKVQIPQGASKINIPDNMFEMKSESPVLGSATSYLNGQEAPKAPQMENRTTDKNWTDAIPFIKAGKDFATDIAPDIKRGADQINSVLGFQPIVDATNEAIDYNQKKADFDNINFRYRDLLDMVTKDGRKDLSIKQQETDKQFAQLMIDKFGADDVMVNSRGEMAVVKDGKRHVINDSFWETLKDGTWSSRSEIGSDITGGALGGYIGQLLNKDPKKKAISTILGGLAGSATSSMLGRYVDVMRNAYQTRQELTNAQKADIMADAGGGNAVLGVGATSVAAPIVKSAKGIKQGYEFAKDYLLKENMSGAKSLAKDAKVDIVDIHNQRSKFETASGESGKELDQDMLASAAMSNERLWSEAVSAIKEDVKASTEVATTLTKRADKLIEMANNGAIEPEGVVRAIQDFEKDVISTYGNMVEDMSRLFPDYKVKSKELQDIIVDARESIGQLEAKSHFNAILHDMQKNPSLSVNNLFTLRRDVDNFMIDNAKDKSVRRALVNAIDEYIFKAIDGLSNKNLATNMKKGFIENKQRYSDMFEMQGSKAYKDIMREAASSEDVSNSMLKHSKAIEDSLFNISKNLSPEKRAGMEMRVIADTIKKSLVTSDDGQRAVDFKALLKTLGNVNKQNIQSENARVVIETIEEMSKKFGLDTQIFSDVKGGKIKTPDGGISPDPLGRLETVRGVWLFKMIMSYLPTQAGKSLAFKRHVLASLKKARTPKEFLELTEKFPNTPPTLWKSMRPLIQEYIKIEEAEQYTKFQKAEAESLAKEEADRLANESAIAQRNERMQKELEEKKKPRGKINRQAQEVQRVSVGDSEDEAKENVKSMFKKRGETPKYTKEDIEYLSKEDVTDEENPFSDNYRGGYTTNPIIENILGAGIGSTAPIDTDGDGKITVKDRVINALIAMGAIRSTKITNKEKKNIAELIDKLLNGGTPRKDSVRIGKGIKGLEDFNLYLEKGTSKYSTKSGKYFGHGIEKLINEHVARKGDLELQDIINMPELLGKAKYHWEGNDIVFNFPTQKDEELRIVFSNAKKGEDLDLNTKMSTQKTVVSQYRPE